MRNRIKLAVAAMAGTLVSAPAIAADFGIALLDQQPLVQQHMALTGNVALWGTIAFPSGYDNEDFSGDQCDSGNDPDWCRTAFGFGGDARMHYRFNDAHGVQIELLGDYLTSMSTEEGDGEMDEANLHLAGGLHLISRSNPAHPIGIFGGIAGTASMSEDERPLHAFGGLEGAMINGNQTYFGQVGGVILVSGDDTMENMVFGRVGARHFFNPNSRIEAAVAAGYSPNYDHDDDDANTATWLQFAAEYERKHDDNPFSWFVGYQGDLVAANDTSCCDQRVWTHAVKVGVRMSIGPTLQYENDHGARTFTFTNLAAPIGYAADMN